MTVSGGWSDWEARLAGRGCVLCASLGAGDSDYHVHVADAAYSELRLERRTRIKGYCVVIWRHGHVAEPTDLDTDRACGYWTEVLAASRAIFEVFSPLKVNYLTLGNTVPHLHTHLVPRYRDDPAPGAPLQWEQIVHDEPRADMELHEEARQLRRILDTG